jgi:hypothetical protein
LSGEALSAATGPSWALRLRVSMATAWAAGGPAAAARV